jgi:DNA-directed RNA polymerase subunit RPC12/RpoP
VIFVMIIVMKLSKSYNFKVIHPELAKQWHPLKNGNLRPADIMPFTGKNIWWLCEKGHVWQSTVHQRLRYPGCPFCKHKRPGRDYNLQVIKPELASLWHPTKNFKLKPTQVMPFSYKKVWWKCKKGHDWFEYISVMSRGRGCPYCSGKRASKKYNFQAVHPELAKQWHPTKNGDLTPDQVTPGSKKKVWWRCEKGHEYEMRILARRHGSGCPYCSGKRVSKEYNLQAVHPELAKQWHPTKNEKLTPDQVTPGSKKKVWWRCEKDHDWMATIDKRSSGRGCPYCSRRRKASKERDRDR